MADYATYLSNFKYADLYLDTFVYNAGATASDALRAGLPVLTKSGLGYSARMATSLLHAVHLPELITEDEYEYEAKALQLAQDPKALQKIKKKLAKNLTNSPLFNSKLFTENFERAMEKAFEISLANQKPCDIEIRKQTKQQLILKN